ncbi:hypothetical protein GCM10010435_85940 [Winogradskya consettensis]|uniref:Thioredoxin domain-containing protein n=1 Tax=Winogradskya consettensis TaxID=113560 RepID=A0A919SKP7_9ACTN|nr:hypothetical protein Aco04nite_30450 [Actinoplanes consettensis]
MVLLLSACTATAVTPTPTASSPFAGCSFTGGSGPAPDLPALTLPCFTGGAEVRTGDLRGPAVINLWSSSCDPCRDELPVMQALADATTGRLQVLGVDTFDSRDAAASFATDFGVTFPTLYDRDRKLLLGLGKTALPVTVFLDADGKRFVYTGTALDKPTLGTLVRTHTGVTVTG